MVSTRQCMAVTYKAQEDVRASQLHLCLRRVRTSLKTGRATVIHECRDRLASCAQSKGGGPGAARAGGQVAQQASLARRGLANRKMPTSSAHGRDCS